MEKENILNELERLEKLKGLQKERISELQNELAKTVNEIKNYDVNTFISNVERELNYIKELNERLKELNLMEFTLETILND